MRYPALALVCIAAYSQIEVQPLRYEVASIKASTANAQASPEGIAPSGALNLNTTVRPLVLIAYKLKDYQLAGDPKWLDSEYYRIVTKPPEGPIPAEQSKRMDRTSEMIRTLLAERFQLTVHHETRSVQEYALVVAKGGPKLKESPQDPNFRFTLGKGKLSTTRGGATMAFLANLLANIVGYPVVNETQLNGYYDIQLTYAPDDKPEAGPSVFAALQEQLGLKLDSRKGPVDVVVIDRIERPSEN